MMAGAISPEEGRLSFRAAFPQISVRVTAHGLPGDVDAKLATLGERARTRIGDYVFGEGMTTMEGVVEDLARARGWKLATAESVTGGLIAERLTNVPGSSQVFAGGVVAYTLEAKEARSEEHTSELQSHSFISYAVFCLK